jgi:hypothetical protein
MLVEAKEWIAEAVVRDFFYDSLESLTNKGNKTVYFIKLNGYFSRVCNEMLSNALANRCLKAVRSFPKDSIAS